MVFKESGGRSEDALSDSSTIKHEKGRKAPRHQKEEEEEEQSDEEEEKDENEIKRSGDFLSNSIMTNNENTNERLMNIIATAPAAASVLLDSSSSTSSSSSTPTSPVKNYDSPAAVLNPSMFLSDQHQDKDAICAGTTTTLVPHDGTQPQPQPQQSSFVVMPSSSTINSNFGPRHPLSATTVTAAASTTPVSASTSAKNPSLSPPATVDMLFAAHQQGFATRTTTKSPSANTATAVVPTSTTAGTTPSSFASFNGITAMNETFTIPTQTASPLNNGTGGTRMMQSEHNQQPPTTSSSTTAVIYEPRISSSSTTSSKSQDHGAQQEYQDFSRIMSCSPSRDESTKNSTRSSPPVVSSSTTLASTSMTTGKEPPFPVKLHEILSNPGYSEYISWLPHGRSWRVLKPKAFEEKIIPLFFRHTKYASFMRQVCFPSAMRIMRM